MIKFKKVGKNIDINQIIYRKFLLNYRNTVRCTTCKSPVELYLNRKFKNKYDLILE